MLNQEKGDKLTQNNGKQNGKRNSLLDFLSAIIYLGRGLWVRRNPESKEDEFFTSEDLEVQNPTDEEEDNDNRNRRN